MSKEFISQLNDSGKASYETLQRFNVLNVETLQKLAALQFSLTSLQVESTVEQAKLLTGSADLNDFFAAESAFANAYSEKLMQITSETTEVFAQSQQKLVAFAEKTFASATSANKAGKAQVRQSKKAATKKVARKAA